MTHVDASQYFLQKQKEFASKSAWPDDDFVFEQLEGSDGTRGNMSGVLSLGENAYLQVYEQVVIAGKTPHRRVYCYTLVINELHAHRWERDPDNHPEDPVHEHAGPDETRVSSTQWVSLAWVLDRSWDEVSLAAEAPFD